jgi:sulfonate transport system ATP-binding protein
MSQVVAEIRNVERAFGPRRVLSGIDLELRAGEFVAIIGKSGSGKSTLLRILAGIDRDVTGEVWASRRRTMVFQDARLLPWLTVLQNVMLGVHRREIASARGALADVGLDGREQAWPTTLSGGEAQRVALARALVRRPRLLLLDEPFGSLDAITRLQMHALMQRLHTAHRPGTLLVTHDIDEALILADRVLVLAGGVFATEIDLGGHAPTRAAEVDRTALRQQLLDALDLPSM